VSDVSDDVLGPLPGASTPKGRPMAAAPIAPRRMVERAPTASSGSASRLPSLWGAPPPSALAYAPEAAGVGAAVVPQTPLGWQAKKTYELGDLFWQGIRHTSGQMISGRPCAAWWWPPAEGRRRRPTRQQRHR